MGIVQRIKNIFGGKRSIERPSTSLSNPGQWFTSIFGGTTQSGSVITANSAAGVPAWYRAVNLLASTVARLPIQVFERDTHGLTLTDNNIARLLTVQPSSYYTPFTFFECIVTGLFNHGNAYAIILRDRSNRPVELRFVNGSVLTHVVDFEGKKYLLYQVTTDLDYDNTSSTVNYFASDVLHFRAFGSHPLVGSSPLSLHRETLGIAISGQDYMANFLGNGGFLSGVIESDLKLTTEQKTAITKGFSEKYGSAKNAGKVAALDYGFKYKPIRLTPADAQYIQNYKLTVQDIARITGVPPHKLFDLDEATMNNMEVMNSGFVETVAGICERIEQELKRKLFKTSDQSKMVIRFNLYEVSRGDMKSRGDYYRTRFNTGSITPNQIRELEGENKSTEGGMDSYYIQVNMQRVQDFSTKNIENE